MMRWDRCVIGRKKEGVYLPCATGWKDDTEIDCGKISI